MGLILHPPGPPRRRSGLTRPILVEWAVFAALWLATAATGLYVAIAHPADAPFEKSATSLRPLLERWHGNGG